MDSVAGKLFDESQNPHHNAEQNALSKQLFDNVTTDPPKLEGAELTNIEKYIISN